MLPSAFSSKPDSGFTLIELLLALALSALIAALAYAGISSAIQADAGLTAATQRLLDIQRTLNILEEDLVQIRPRSITSNVGSSEPALIGGSFNSPVLIFTRAGMANPAGLQRSELQRVQYQLEQGRLWRQYRWELDGADLNTAPNSVLLLEGVQSLVLEFLPAMAQTQALDLLSLQSNASYWESYWDSSQLSSGQNRVLPLAIRLTLEIENFGQVQRVIELP